MTISTSPFRGPARRLPIPAMPSASVSVLIAIGIVMAALVMAVSLPAQPEPSYVSDILISADAIDQHAVVMSQDGQGLADRAKAAASTDRAIWLATAQHMISDSSTLKSMADQLRAGAALIGSDPIRRANASPATLASVADLLRTEGQAALDHGNGMVAQSEMLAALAARPGSGMTARDAALLRSGASGIVDAGERTLAIAQRLDAGADQLRRALGR